MKSYLSDMKSGLNNGDLSMKDFDIDALRDMDSYRTIMNDIYGDGYVEGKEMEPILDKMLNGENLTGDEREKLYDYFQNEYLDDESKKEVESIADSINEDGVDDLKERLNEKVIVSKDSVKDEMAMIQAYVYMGDNQPGELNIDRIQREKLESYVMVLEDYHAMMGEETVATVDMLEYEKDPENMSGHRFKSALQTAEYGSGTQDIMSEEEYREFIFDSDNPQAKNFTRTDVTYFATSDGSKLRNHLENEKLAEENANYTYDFLMKEAANELISQIPNKIGKSIEVGQKIVDYKEGKKDNENDMTIKKASETADFLNMELVVSKREQSAVNEEAVKAEVKPTDSTFNLLERWKDAEKDEDRGYVPYPKELIESRDWKGISEYLTNHNTSFDRDDYDYITGGPDE